MRSLFATLLGLALPAGAPPGTARIFIGTPLPAPLDAYTFTFAGVTYRYTGGMIFYGDGDDTTYDYLCQAGPVLAGASDLVLVHMGEVISGVVQEQVAGTPAVQEWSTDRSGPVNVQSKFWTDNFQIFTDAAAVPFQVDNSHAQLAVDAGKTLTLGGAGKTFASHGQLETLTSASWKVDTTGYQVWLGATPGSEQPAYIPYQLQAVLLGGAVVINALAAPGTALITVNVTVLNATDIFVVRGQWDVLATIAPTGNFDGILNVDGATQTEHAVWRIGVAGSRIPATQQWEVTGLAPGVHVFQLAAFAGVAGQYSVQANNSKLTIDARYHK